MNTRKGQFTIANLIAVVFLFFIFAVVGKFAIFPLLADTAKDSSPMLSALLKTLPALILSAIVLLPASLAAKKRLNRKNQRVRGERRR